MAGGDDVEGHPYGARREASRGQGSPVVGEAPRDRTYRSLRGTRKVGRSPEQVLG